MPRELLDATSEADIVSIPARSVIAIDGEGEPGSERFQRALRAAYGIAVTLKLARKRERRDDFAIGPLEGRWWSDQILPCSLAPRHAWRWTLRMAVPRDVTKRDLSRAVAAVTAKRGGALEKSEDARRVRLDRLPRQRVGRILHVGPYATESASLAKVRDEIERHGLSCADRHAEVYLGDPRRARPDRLRTVLLRELAEEGPPS
ncbi:MAG: GyrI-like domain-containing protein [Chloroflexota bacterium]|nr:GyrI-like domain-containing protein [Chloroflexota bacterium]